MPPKRQEDGQTAMRAELAELARVQTVAAVKAAHRRGDRVALLGEFNSIVAPFRFRGLRLRVVFGSGLDRMLITRRGSKIFRTWRLPKVGVGPDLQHEGLAAVLTVTPARKHRTHHPPDDPKPMEAP